MRSCRRREGGGREGRRVDERRRRGTDKEGENQSTNNNKVCDGRTDGTRGGHCKKVSKGMEVLAGGCSAASRQLAKDVFAELVVMFRNHALAS